MKIVLSHPTSNEVSRYAVNGLLEADALSEFHTAIAVFPGTLLSKISRIKGLQELNRRSFSPALERFTKTSPWLEMGRQVALKMKLSTLTAHESGVFSVDAIYKNLDNAVAHSIKSSNRKGITGVYAFEDGALQSFTEAKKQNIKCFYDLPIGYWRAAKRLLELEKERWPQWSTTLSGFKDSKEKLQTKDQELLLADQIFVGSNFTKETLKDFPGNLAPVTVIPYGFPQVISDREYSSIKNRKLKLLFVGGLSQRKGIADLFAVADLLKSEVELTVVGRKTTEECEALNKALSKHNWIPSLPHDQILELMQHHDVLVFPSLFEGFGLVITEAMSQGLPVITTERTIGPDFISNKENGWLIQAGSTTALQKAVEHLLNNPDQVTSAGMAAMQTAKNRTWSQYQTELISAIRN
jgi:glycosyltransferase involved in cell wall biosynthesis